MAATARDVEVDSLAALEDRITRAVDVVSRLRSEKDSLSAQMDAVIAERDAAQKATAELQGQFHKALQELEELRSERKQVRTRIEKLLGQMDLLSTS